MMAKIGFCDSCKQDNLQLATFELSPEGLKLYCYWCSLGLPVPSAIQPVQVEKCDLTGFPAFSGKVLSQKPKSVVAYA